MINKFINVFILSFLVQVVFVFHCLAMERMLYVAPSQLPNTTKEMKTAGYWIARHPSPDQIVLSTQAISQLNLQIQNELKLTKELLSYPENINGDDFRNRLKSRLEEIKKKEYRQVDGRQLKESCFSKDISPDECVPFGDFFAAVLENSNLKTIPKEVQAGFGFMIHYAHQRFFPTDEILTTEPKDIDFDELQNSALDIGTPIVILHESKDKLWLYVESQFSQGWVKKVNVAQSTQDEFIRYFNEQHQAVIVAAKADIFLDEQLTKHYGYVQMGQRFSLVKSDDVKVQIQIPVGKEDGRVEFKSAFLNREDVHDGVLSYSGRNILKQAFKMLNSPYGWGGMYGEQDCSRFLQQVYASVGIYLPRDSKDQAQVGELIASFDDQAAAAEKLDILNTKATAGMTILPLKGHIMIYLGMVENRPYAIHATWGYRQKQGNDDVVRVLNRVVVSDFLLGEGSTKGSLLERLKAIRTIR